MSIVITILILGVLIFVHEFGHFIVAKKSGIRVNEFALGMGPRILSKERGETVYSLRLLPIGGFCAMEGEDGDFEAPDGFSSKPIGKRFAVVFAGPFMNLIFAVLLFVIAFMYFGAPASTALVGSVVDKAPAYTAGVQAGDTIVEINGEKVNSWKTMTVAIAENADKQMNIVVERGEELVPLTLTPTINEDTGGYMIGVTQGVEKLSLLQSIKYGFIQTYEFTKELLVLLYQMVTGQIAPDLAGPVGIVSIVGDVAETGYMRLFLLAGILSVNLGVMNLLPLPALDGGRILFMGIELVRGKPVSREKEAMVHFVGIVLLFGLMLLITYKDIMRLISGS